MVLPKLSVSGKKDTSTSASTSADAGAGLGKSEAKKSKKKEKKSEKRALKSKKGKKKGKASKGGKGERVKGKGEEKTMELPADSKLPYDLKKCSDLFGSGEKNKKYIESAAPQAKKEWRNYIRGICMALLQTHNVAGCNTNSAINAYIAIV